MKHFQLENFGQWKSGRRWMDGAVAAFAAAALVACGGGGGDGGADFDASELIKAGPGFTQSATTPLSGAVFTTTVACGNVNVNIFTDKADVYLNGGPRRPGSAGLLPNTSYYVKVTEPNGTLLGISDGAPVSTNALGEFTTCPRLVDILYEPDGSGNPDLTKPGYLDTGNNGGEYKVWVSLVANFVHSGTKTDNFKVKSSGCTSNCDPEDDATVVIEKWYDANGNGVRDGGEPLMTGWKVELDGETGFTPATFDKLAPNTSMTAYEFAPNEASWLPTGAMVDSQTATHALSAWPYLMSVGITTPANGQTMTVSFGNVCIGFNGGGRTIGFWRNKNGQALITEAALAELRDLNLTNGVSAFNPTQKSQLIAWLQGANAVDMRYMLSAQLAAMSLNTTVGWVDPAATVYAPGVVSGSDFTSIANLISLANAALVMTSDAQVPAHLPGVTLRQYQELLKNALDDANNNLNFVAPTPEQCPEQPTFGTSS